MELLNNKIIFVHIEKAAGTTFHHILLHNFKKYYVIRPIGYWTNSTYNSFTQQNYKLLSRLSPKFDGIGGHNIRPYINYSTGSTSKLFYITFLRDPVTRYISQYLYHTKKMKLKYSFQKFVDEERFNNWQTKKIAGTANLETAKSILLKKINFVGITENFEISLLLLKQLYLKNLVLYYELKNQSRDVDSSFNFKDLSTKLKQKIIENNRLDIDLYQFARNKIFSKYLDQYDGDVLSDKDKFVIYNKSLRYNKIENIYIKLRRAYFYYIVEPTIFKKDTKNELNQIRKALNE